VRLLVEPSFVADDDIAALREAGWSDRVLDDLVALVALNQLTGTLHPAGLVPPRGMPE
jgi:hypothetical protein